jgi:hypothetical protein
VAVGRVDRDRQPDLVVAKEYPSGLLLFLNRGRARAPRVAIKSKTLHRSPAYSLAAVRLACHGGVGRCTGALEFLVGHKRVGRRRFSIPTGATGVVRAHVPDRRHIIRLVAVAGGPGTRVRRKLVLTPSTTAQRRAACLPRHATILAASNRGRVFSRDGEPEFAEGCLFAVGRRWRLSRGDALPQAAAPIATAGRFVAYHGLSCGEGESGCDHELEVMDLVTGRFRAQLFNARAQGNCNVGDGGDCGLGSIGSIALKPNGSVAWIACSGTGDDECDRELPAATVVIRADRTGRHVLDSGRRVRPRSIRLADGGRAIVWRHGAGRRRAPLR